MANSTTTITYLPTPVPDVQFFARGEGDVSQDYLAAAYDDDVLVFEHKLTLSSGGQVLQVMSKDSNGMFTVALPEDAYSIDDDFTGIQLYEPDTGANGEEFSIRLFKDSTTRNTVVPGTTSQVVLPDAQNNPPQVMLAEAVHQIGTTTLRELNFIGATDIRTFTVAEVIIRPGETVYVKRDSNGDLVFQF